MTNVPEDPNQPRPVSARRQHRIDLANANIKKHTRQRIGWFHDRGIPAERIALSVGVPIETVLEQTSE